ncbi:TetR/AcrR family transcriptional regulator [Sphingomonas sp.]|uniref:TetR/AcrR family transcriptional regulator n=1 Tax=Sphingomonas sp. TaxID=28214 RepID=UPI002DD6651D|nr:TetR/AcrR family transcriptional regulator [Sphingomonas sp.]
MPKITDEKRAARQMQILEAAWSCFQKQGLHATTMSDIIAASHLSAGAVYSYFPSKEELILAAVKASLTGLRERVEPLLNTAPLPSPARLVEDIAGAVTDFTSREGYDLRRVALLGWSEAQRNEHLRETMQVYYLAFRARLDDIVEHWKRAGEIPKTAGDGDVAKALLSMILGFVVQSAITGDISAKDLARGLHDLVRREGADAA